MSIELTFICGLMCGLEYVQDPDEGTHYLVVDFLFVRTLFSWG
jgi:hypothetical protein